MSHETVTTEKPQSAEALEAMQNFADFDPVSVESGETVQAALRDTFTSTKEALTKFHTSGLAGKSKSRFNPGVLANSQPGQTISLLTKGLNERRGRLQLPGSALRAEVDRNAAVDTALRAVLGVAERDLEAVKQQATIDHFAAVEGGVHAAVRAIENEHGKVLEINYFAAGDPNVTDTDVVLVRN